MWRMRQALMVAVLAVLVFWGGHHTTFDAIDHLDKIDAEALQVRIATGWQPTVEEPTFVLPFTDRDRYARLHNEGIWMELLGLGIGVGAIAVFRLAWRDRDAVAAAKAKDGG
jgi:hypothetical protein